MHSSRVIKMSKYLEGIWRTRGKDMACLLIFFITYLSMSQIKAPVMTEDFRLEYGQRILENTSRILSRTSDTTYADYWNLALAHCLLSGNKTKVEALLLKSKTMNGIKFQSLIDDSVRYYGSIENLPFYKILGEKFVGLIEMMETPDSVITRSLISNTVIPASLLNIGLMDSIKSLLDNDQKYRSSPDFSQNQTLIKKQRILDDANGLELFKIFKAYGYPGISLVGAEYASYAAIVMTHTNNVELLQFLFPYALKAYQQYDLSENVFILLVDRYHWRIDGKQIFGTQVGIPFYDEDQIIDFKKKYLKE